jgi:carboxylate-amine ligase
VFAFPLSGRAPFILSWETFANDYFTKMEHTGVINSMKDFYWDLRPKPEYGTIELRVCDTPLSVERAAALACYLQTLCRYLLERNEPEPTEDDYLVYNYNRFQACRFGLDGTVVHPKTYEQIPLRDDILKTLDKLQTHSQSLACEEALRCIAEMANTGNDASYLRQQYKDSGNVEGMVAAALEKFKT